MERVDFFMAQQFSSEKFHFRLKRENNLLTFSMESFVDLGILCFNHTGARKCSVNFVNSFKINWK